MIQAKRLTKTQRRIDDILSNIPPVREQLLVALDELETGMDSTPFVEASLSDDPRQRNKIAAIERLFEGLVNWVDELAERILAEARRANLVAKQGGRPYEQLVDQHVVSVGLAEKLNQAKDLRDLMQHGYPLGNLIEVHQIITEFPNCLDNFLVGFVRFRAEIEL